MFSKVAEDCGAAHHPPEESRNFLRPHGVPSVRRRFFLFKGPRVTQLAVSGGEKPEKTWWFKQQTVIPGLFIEQTFQTGVFKDKPDKSSWLTGEVKPFIESLLIIGSHSNYTFQYFFNMIYPAKFGYLYIVSLIWYPCLTTSWWRWWELPIPMGRLQNLTPEREMEE